MPKYRISVCDGNECEELTANDPEVAKRKMTRAMRKRAKKLRKDKTPEGRIVGEVREVNRGILADKPMYTGKEEYGTPSRGGRRSRKPKSESSE